MNTNNRVLPCCRFCGKPTVPDGYCCSLGQAEARRNQESVRRLAEAVRAEQGRIPVVSGVEIHPDGSAGRDWTSAPAAPPGSTFDGKRFLLFEGADCDCCYPDIVLPTRTGHAEACAVHRAVLEAEQVQKVKDCWNALYGPPEAPGEAPGRARDPEPAEDRGTVMRIWFTDQEPGPCMCYLDWHTTSTSYRMMSVPIGWSLCQARDGTVRLRNLFGEELTAVRAGTLALAGLRGFRFTGPSVPVKP